MAGQSDKADTTGDAAATSLDMPAFFPYRLAVVAEAVSQTMAAVYADRFALTRQEWRVLAALADRGPATATEVAEYSTLDKMQVSRAVAALEARGAVVRSPGAEDRRTKTLVMTPGGRDLFAAIVPLVLERQERLLAGFSPDERAVLATTIERLLDSAGRLLADGGQAASDR